MTPIEFVVAVVIGLGGGVGLAALFRAKSQNNKDRADAVSVVSDAAGRQVERLEGEVNRVVLRAVEAETALTNLRVEMESLLAEVQEYRRRYGPLRPAASS